MSKPRFGARIDGTQPAIADALEAAGAKVQVLDVSAEGCPDLLVGFLGQLTLLECKARLGKLSESQVREHEAWARVGVKVATARSVPEALRAIGCTPEAFDERRAGMRELARALDPQATARRRLQPAIRRPA